mmetsp:Transcript_9663/g.15859  ORF Transcript_9663/g.15859 Transcript_9663/m.15859 type:complete len:382 (-) Transcript_9663:38-1183(-)
MSAEVGIPDGVWPDADGAATVDRDEPSLPRSDSNGKIHDGASLTLDLGQLQDVTNETFDGFLVSQVEDVCLEKHRRWKIRHTGLDEQAAGVVTYYDIYMNTEAETSKRLCFCPLCKCKVGVSRFAMHLETCVRRGTRRVSKKLTYPGEDAIKSTVKRVNKRARHTVSKTKKKQKPPQKDAVTRADLIMDDEFRCRLCCALSLFDNSMVLCDGCDRGYHVGCLIQAGYLAKLGQDASQLEKTAWELVLRKDQPWFCIECAPLVLSTIPGSIGSSYFGMTAKQKIDNGRDFAPCYQLEFVCDVCGTLITGTRWRCLVCNNFDACVSCHNSLLADVESVGLKPGEWRGDSPESKDTIETVDSPCGPGKAGVGHLVGHYMAHVRI